MNFDHPVKCTIISCKRIYVHAMSIPLVICVIFGIDILGIYVIVSCNTGDGNNGNLSVMNETKEILTFSIVLKDGTTVIYFIQ